MKKLKLLFLCMLQFLLCANIYAQVYNGNLTFSSQADIDNFSTTSFTSVNGNLNIRDDLDGQHDITNLAGLAGLTAVTGAVVTSTSTSTRLCCAPRR